MRILILAIVSVVVWAQISRADDPGTSDPIEQMMFFGGSQPNHIPQYIDTLSLNPIAKSIVLACLSGASREDLDTLHLQNLQDYLNRLISLRLLVKKDDRYFLTLPVFVGERRERLRALADSGAAGITAVVATMIPRLRGALGDRPDACFHVLWSRLIDADWWHLYRVHTGNNSTPPSLAWIVDPPHPYQVGTNFWSMTDEDELAVTWGYGCLDCVMAIQNARPYLIGKQTARPNDSVMAVLAANGLVDAKGAPRVFSYSTGGKLDQFLDSLKEVYAQACRNTYDFAALQREFGVAPEDMFVILMHETAYSIFERLNHSGDLPIPAILRGRTDKRSCVQLASVRRLESR